jgi:hypothetical protein
MKDKGMNSGTGYKNILVLRLRMNSGVSRTNKRNE